MDRYKLRLRELFKGIDVNPDTVDELIGSKIISNDKTLVGVVDVVDIDADIAYCTLYDTLYTEKLLENYSYERSQD